MHLLPNLRLARIDGRTHCTMREVRVFVCSLMFFLEHLRKPERLLHVHFYFDAHCTSAFRVDSPISIWPHYISVNQEMKLMHTIIKIAVVLVLSLFAIVGWLVFLRLRKQSGIVKRKILSLFHVLISTSSWKEPF